MLTKEDIQFNKGTSMWKGVMLKDMSKEELIEAMYDMGQYYEGRLRDDRKVYQDLSILHSDRMKLSNHTQKTFLVTIILMSFCILLISIGNLISR